VRFDGDGARAFYRALPEQLRAAAPRRDPLRTIVERGARAGRRARARSALGRRRAAGELEVRENGLRFGVDLRTGRRAGCSWTSATTARWCGRWRAARAC
jgi:hypothetical protein